MSRFGGGEGALLQSGILGGAALAQRDRALSLQQQAEDFSQENTLYHRQLEAERYAVTRAADEAGYAALRDALGPTPDPMAGYQPRPAVATDPNNPMAGYQAAQVAANPAAAASATGSNLAPNPAAGPNQPTPFTGPPTEAMASGPPAPDQLQPVAKEPPPNTPGGAQLAPVPGMPGQPVGAGGPSFADRVLSKISPRDLARMSPRMQDTIERAVGEQGAFAESLRRHRAQFNEMLGANVLRFYMGPDPSDPDAVPKLVSDLDMMINLGLVNEADVIRFAHPEVSKAMLTKRAAEMNQQLDYLSTIYNPDGSVTHDPTLRASMAGFGPALVSKAFTTKFAEDHKLHTQMAALAHQHQESAAARAVISNPASTPLQIADAQATLAQYNEPVANPPKPEKPERDPLADDRMRMEAKGADEDVANAQDALKRAEEDYRDLNSYTHAGVQHKGMLQPPDQPTDKDRQVAATKPEGNAALNPFSGPTDSTISEAQHKVAKWEAWRRYQTAGQALTDAQTKRRTTMAKLSSPPGTASGPTFTRAIPGQIAPAHGEDERDAQPAEVGAPLAASTGTPAPDNDPRRAVVKDAIKALKAAGEPVTEASVKKWIEDNSPALAGAGAESE